MDHNRRAAKGRHGNWSSFFFSWSVRLLFPPLFLSAYILSTPRRLCLPVTLISPHSPKFHLLFAASHLSPSLPLSNSPVTLHSLCTHLRLTDIRGDAAIKDEPGTVNQPLLAPPRAVEPWHLHVWWERQRDYKRHRWIISGTPMTHLSSISDAVIVITKVSNDDSFLH